MHVMFLITALTILYYIMLLLLITSNNHRLESAGLNAPEEVLRCWECTEKIVKPACVYF